MFARGARTAQIVPLAVALTVLLSIGDPRGRAYACTCVGGMTEAGLRAQADAVFRGLVVYRRDPPPVVTGNQVVLAQSGTVWTFLVESAEKGRLVPVQQVASPAGAGSCGSEFEIGGRYRVYASRRQGGQLVTGTCAGNRVLTDAFQTVSLTALLGLAAAVFVRYRWP